MIYILRTTVGRENAVMTTLTSRVRADMGIKSVFHPQELKGYIFIEAVDLDVLDDILKNLPHIRGLIRKDVPIAEIQRFLEEKKVNIKVEKGDIVEVIGGPFKNEKGKVTRVDESKEEITIELLEAAISIPITVDIKSVKVMAEKKVE
ncbi:MAG: transcription elongation factor Spt5 [Nanoarchaeota archaeon]|nr:transcription elongation factor Spt5 [Nanoarchaeota archaeon]MBU4123966.1 transcription elongation factor Spt5 [Nanoarchaeota archaeon]